MASSNANIKVVAVALVSLMALGAVVSLTGQSSRPAAQPADNTTIAAGPATPDLTKVDPTLFLDPKPVGEKAPDFAATSAQGKPVKLSQYLGKKNVILVFYQGSFCTVCGHQLADLQGHLSAFNSRNTEILAISADDAAHAKKSVGEHGLSFPVIPNPDKSIIQKYGVANISRGNIAWPSAFVVDKKGVIRLSFADKNAKRLHTEDFLPILDSVAKK